MNNSIFVGVGCMMLALAAQAQNTRPEISIKKIDVNLSPAPRYSVQGQTVPGQAPSPDSSKKWLVTEAELESTPDWADEVSLRFYIVANYGPSAKDASPDGFDVLTTSVTVVNMPRNVGTGKKNIVPVFMDANTVKKYGVTGVQQFIPEVVVQVMYKGVLQDTRWMKSEQTSGRFWEKKQPRAGVLLNLSQSPWAPAFNDYFEQVKPISSAPAAF